MDTKLGEIGSNHLLLVVMMLVIALLPAESLTILGKEALPHVNDLPVHIVARVCLLGRVHDMSFVEFLHQAECQARLSLLQESFMSVSST